MLDLRIEDADIDELLQDLNRTRSEPLSIDADRRRVVREFQDVHACPGSGKTTLVGVKLLLLATRWRERYSGVLVLTHTQVARDEVIAQLRRRREGQKLLSYPHFIGTIQEFVDSFLGIPFCRSCGTVITAIDDEECVEAFERRFASGTRHYLKKHPNASLAKFKWRFSGSKLIMDVPSFDKESSSPAYKDMVAVKKALSKEGMFFYSEMYELGKLLLAQNPDLLETLRRRFPVVIIDEMQDTQRYQDDLMRLIFPSDEVRVQRLGDPDQAIFDGFDEEPNVSFNAGILLPITGSHRFSTEIAAKIRGLSLRKLDLTTCRQQPGDGIRSSIILYRDESVTRVLERFGELVEHLPVDHRKEVRALGGVGKEPGPTGLSIKTYWPRFEKAKSNGIFRAGTLRQSVRYAADLETGDAVGACHVVTDAVIKLLKLASAGQKPNGHPRNRTGLKKLLRERGQDLAFGEWLAEVILGTFPNEAAWARRTDRLMRILQMEEAVSSVREFLAYDSQPLPGTCGSGENTNIYRCANGICVKVSTIHAAKGETHDATLVLETKYWKLYDIHQMLEFLCDESKARPVYDANHPNKKESIRAGFMKKIYVASSRPRHLLCLAVHRDRMSTAIRTKLTQEKQWELIEI